MPVGCLGQACRALSRPGGITVHTVGTVGLRGRPGCSSVPRRQVRERLSSTESEQDPALQASVVWRGSLEKPLPTAQRQPRHWRQLLGMPPPGKQPTVPQRQGPSPGSWLQGQSSWTSRCPGLLAPPSPGASAKPLGQQAEPPTSGTWTLPAGLPGSPGALPQSARNARRGPHTGRQRSYAGHASASLRLPHSAGPSLHTSALPPGNTGLTRTSRLPVLSAGKAVPAGGQPAVISRVDGYEAQEA